MRRKIQYTEGQKIGNCYFIRDIEVNSNGRLAEFKCECGKLFNATVGSIKQGAVKRCKKCADLLRVEATIKRCATHGMSRHPLYKTYNGMRQRCYNPKFAAYPWYGGSGIGVCDRWRNSFEAFLEDMSPRPSDAHTLERLRVNEDYGPDNCIWLLGNLQNRNKRNTVKITVFGETKSITDWALIVKLPRNIIYDRIYRDKMTPLEALTKKNDGTKRNSKFEIKHTFGYLG